MQSDSKLKTYFADIADIANFDNSTCCRFGRQKKEQKNVPVKQIENNSWYR